MQMMYEVIYKALQETGLDNELEPQDYLNFFCLGTRETSHGAAPTSNGKTSFAPNTPQVREKMGGSVGLREGSKRVTF